MIRPTLNLGMLITSESVPGCVVKIKFKTNVHICTSLTFTRKSKPFFDRNQFIARAPNEIVYKS
jgi:hypothetical protein